MRAEKTINQWLDEYDESHRNPTNKLIHWIMVPAIFFTVFGLLWSLPQQGWMMASAWFNWATLLSVPMLLFYLRLSPALTVGMALFIALCLYLAYWLDLNSPVALWLLCIGVFIAAWIFQFIGHRIEGKKPSFFKDVQFLLIGPVWLVSFIYRRLKMAHRRTPGNTLPV